MPARLLSRLCWPAVLVFALLIAAPAQAQVTETSIASPTDPRYVLYEYDAPSPATLAISGTAVGSGNVDIVCVNGRNGMTQLGGSASNVPVVDGAFSVAEAPLEGLAGAGSPINESRTCRLHAVPAGTTPVDFAAFQGPRLAVSKFANIRMDESAGPNDGVAVDYYMYQAGIGFSSDARSFGNCGIYDSFIQDPVTFDFLSAPFYCNGYPRDNGDTWGLYIDGGPAYPPGTMQGGIGGAGLQAVPGVPQLTADVDFDSSNGDVAVTETNPLVGCSPDNSYPPTFPGCTSFTEVPVQMERTTEHVRHGQVIKVTDTWSSTDGQPHDLDLRLTQDFCFDDCSATIVYRFPGEGSYAEHDGNPLTPPTATVAGPLPAAGPILVKDPSDSALGGAAIVPGQSSDGAEFDSTDTFGLHYDDRTIPSTGSLAMTHYYATGRTPAEAEQLADEIVSSLRPLPPAVTPPAVTPPTGASKRPTWLRRGRASVRRRGATFVVATGDRVRCPAGGARCVIRVSAKAALPPTASARRKRARRVVVGTARITVAAGKTVKVAFRLNRKAAKALRRSRKLRLAVTLSARAGNGPAVTRKRSLTIKPPPR